MEPCSIGKHESKMGEESQCNGKRLPRESIGSPELRLIRLRSGIRKKKKKVCEKHLKKWLISYLSHQLFCCNPLDVHQKQRKGVKAGLITVKGTYGITLDLRDQAKGLEIELIPGQKLCTGCKVKLSNMMKRGNIVLPVTHDSSPSQPSLSLPSSISSPGASLLLPSQSNSSPLPIDYNQSHLDLLNQWLNLNGKDPIDMYRLKHQKSYLFNQLQKVRKILELFGGLSVSASAEDDTVECWYNNSHSFREILSQLQEYFQSCESNSGKVHALSVLPKSWSVAQVQNHFDVSSRIVRLTKTLVNERGLLCSVDKKGGKLLSEETVAAVKEFYYRQDISRELPGKNNYVSVKENGKRFHKTKRLVLGNLSHIHDEFCKDFPQHKISLSKFCALRPRECCLASGSGFHNVCVCTLHENPKLMFDGTQLKNIREWNSVSDCIQMSVCSSPTTECYLRSCNSCPDMSILREKLEVYFDGALMETITYNQWETVDQSNILTLTSTVEEFIEDFISKFEVLVTHNFISKFQAAFIKNLKQDLKDEVIVVGDFSENFTFIVQDSAQGFYFIFLNLCVLKAGLILTQVPAHAVRTALANFSNINC